MIREYVRPKCTLYVYIPNAGVELPKAGVELPKAGVELPNAGAVDVAPNVEVPEPKAGADVAGVPKRPVDG